MEIDRFIYLHPSWVLASLHRCNHQEVQQRNERGHLAVVGCGNMSCRSPPWVALEGHLSEPRLPFSLRGRAWGEEPCNFVRHGVVTLFRIAKSAKKPPVKHKIFRLAALCGLVASALFAESKTETITLRPSPNEFVIKCETPVPNESVPGSERIRIAVHTELKVVANRETNRCEMVLGIQAKMSGGNLNGTYTGEKDVTIQTFDADVKEIEIEERKAHDHNFEFSERDWNSKKHFEWTHQGFRQDALKNNTPNKLPIKHIYYEGEANRTLRIVLNSEITASITPKK